MGMYIQLDLMEFMMVNLIVQNWCQKTFAIKLFFNKAIFKKIEKFNLKFKVHADWDHNIRCFYSSKIKKEYIDIIVANYADGGFSSLNFDTIFKKIRLYKCLYLGYNQLTKKTIKKLIKEILKHKKV